MAHRRGDPAPSATIVAPQIELPVLPRATPYEMRPAVATLSAKSVVEWRARQAAPRDERPEEAA